MHTYNKAVKLIQNIVLGKPWIFLVLRSIKIKLYILNIGMSFCWYLIDFQFNIHIAIMSYWYFSVNLIPAARCIIQYKRPLLFSSKSFVEYQGQKVCIVEVEQRWQNRTKAYPDFPQLDSVVHSKGHHHRRISVSQLWRAWSYCNGYRGSD